MSKGVRTPEQRTRAMAHDLEQLAEDAGALMSATAGMAGDEVEQARKRMGAALERGRELYGRVRAEADEVIHNHPYQGIALGVGVGALFGFLLARKFQSRAGRY